MDLSEKALDQEVCITPMTSLNREKHILLLHLKAPQGSHLIAILLTLTTARRMIFYSALVCFVLQYTILYKYIKLSVTTGKLFSSLYHHTAAASNQKWDLHLSFASGEAGGSLRGGGNVFNSPLHRKHLVIPVLCMDSYPSSGAKIKGISFSLHEDTS